MTQTNDSATPAPSLRRLNAAEARRRCDPAFLNFQTTNDLPILNEIIGQARATQAIEFGINMRPSGFNIFALGPSGSGKTTTIQQYLAKQAAARPTPDDWCYVYNFDNPDTPRALRLPAGTASAFRDDLQALVKSLRDELPKAFEAEPYTRQRSQIIRKATEARQAILQEVDSDAARRGFSLVQMPNGIIITPILHGKPITPEEYEALDPIQRAEYEGQRPALQDLLENALRRVRELEKQAEAELESLDQSVARSMIEHRVAEMQARYDHGNIVRDYLEDLTNDIVTNVDSLREGQTAAEAPARPMMKRESPWERYRVNVLVDNTKQSGAPVIIERNPTYYNLLGRIEYRVDLGALVTDLAMIKPGALHRANGGYLVIEAIPLLRSPFALDGLKRALVEQRIVMEEMGAELRIVPTASLAPEPIPLDIKIVLIGEPQIYYTLFTYDEEFRNLFKVKADFDTELAWNQENIQHYARFVAARVKDEGLLPVQSAAVGQIIEYSARLVEDREKLSTRFGDIADLVRESSYWAGKADQGEVRAEDVKTAITQRIYRANRVEERMQEFIMNGTIMVDTQGSVVGQVNGLSVLGLGDYEFGRPSRITARTSVGKEGLVNIEREVKMSGPIHDKGVLILTGYLHGKYGRHQLLSFSASIVFEQSYEEVEGDSASAAELFTLLSSLADLPVKQTLAVTGSINQQGMIQPIGGVNEKIEGFFDVCTARGLTGDQGVIIPVQNVRNLMLREDVVEAIAQGRFHIYPISTAGEGISLLTGVPAGELQPDGMYPPETVNGRVEDRLVELADLAKEAPEPEGNDPDEREGAADA